jgi:chemotaxis protein methyltransferase CheR
MVQEKQQTISGLQEKILHNSDCFHRTLSEFVITVSAMFRNPDFFSNFRKQVVPWLKTYPFIRLWFAGCGCGEELYSMAILLYEEGLLDRCRFYGTDINEPALQKAQKGIFPLHLMQEYTRNYLAADGKSAFSKYYTAKYNHAIFHSWLKQRFVFSKHNLVSDSSFNEFQVILCRNVLIYFNNSLQQHVHKLIYTSLVPLGFLGLGESESIFSTPYRDCYKALNERNKIYQKIK